MPPKDSMHVAMLREYQGDRMYGLQWGDPDERHDLMMVRDYWLRPYIGSKTWALEIGPGGGRWTRYMLESERIYVVDRHPEVLKELSKNIAGANVVPIHNSANDFPGVPWQCIDFVFSFGTFVHLEADVVRAYLANLCRVLRATANVVIQYADKTKPKAQQNAGFAQNSPNMMRAMVREAGYEIVEEDTELLDHSALIRFRPCPP